MSESKKKTDPIEETPAEVAAETPTEPSTEVAVWKPKPFEGNDLLPMDAAATQLAIEGVPELVGREHVDVEDLILPSLSLLQGLSEAVSNHVDGAKPGVFMHTGTEECLPEGSVRLILAHHHKGNALFPKDDPRYAGLKTCISNDQVEGTEYGLCEECRRCLDWDEVNKLPPLGAETHHFVALSSLGPVMLRFSRSSYKSANKFISSWVTGRKNLWAHPVVVRVAEGTKTLASGKTTKYYYMQMAWQTTETVPPDVQRAAFALYNEVRKKHETGNLKSQDEGGDGEFA